MNWTRILAAVPDLTSTMVAFVVSGDTVWAEWAWTGTRRDGHAHDMRGITVTTVRDGGSSRAASSWSRRPRRGRGRRGGRPGDRGGAGMIAIAGGTGNLGRSSSRGCSIAGDAVRVLARHPDRIPEAWRGKVEGSRGRPRAGVAGRALAGVRALVWAVTGFGGPEAGGVPLCRRRRQPRADPRCGGCGRRARHRDVGRPVRARSSDRAVPRQVRRRAAASRVPRLAWTIVQPTAYMETWVGLLGGPLLRGEHARVVGHGRNPINFVSAADVAFVVDAALSRSAAPRPDRRGAGSTEPLAGRPGPGHCARCRRRAGDRSRATGADPADGRRDVTPPAGTGRAAADRAGHGHA